MEGREGNKGISSSLCMRMNIKKDCAVSMAASPPYHQPKAEIGTGGEGCSGSLHVTKRGEGPGRGHGGGWATS